MFEVTGTWRGRPASLRFDDIEVALISDSGESLVVRITDTGPDAVAAGSMLSIADSTFDIDGPDAEARAAELAAEVREAVRRHGAARSAATSARSRFGRLGVILAFIGAGLIVVGTWAGWATVDEFTNDGFGDSFARPDTDLAQQLALFSSGALLWWLTGVMLVVGGFLLDRLEELLDA